MVSRRYIIVPLLMLLAAFAPGCDTSSGKPKSTLLLGQVVSHGKPIPEGWILFIPLDGQGDSVPAKIVDGNYRAPGVPLGKVRAVISAVQQGEQLPDKVEGEIRYQKINLVPEKYRKGVVVEVKKGQSTVNFDLKD